MNPSLKICGILLTMFDGRTKLSQEVVRQVTEYFRDRVFKTIVPRISDFPKPHPTACP